MVMPSPRPVFLKLSHHLPNILNINTVFTSEDAREADRYHTRTHHAAYLILHGSGGVEQPPMVPRPDPLQILMRLRIGLWGWTADHEALSPIPEAKLPDRVLDLRNCSTGGSKRVRLVETANMSKGSYAALSYCWGGYRGFLTDSKSYNDRCEGTDIEEFPILF